MAKKDIGEMLRAAGFMNQFWQYFVQACRDLGLPAEQVFAMDNSQLRDAAFAAAESVLQSVKDRGGIVGIESGDVSSLVEFAQSLGSANRLDFVSEYVTASALGAIQSLRPHPILLSCAELRPRSLRHLDVVSSIDSQCARPTWAEVLSFASAPVIRGGWNGTDTVCIVPENDEAVYGKLSLRDGSRRLSVTKAGPLSEWSPGTRFLVFSRQ